MKVLWSIVHLFVVSFIIPTVGCDKVELAPSPDLV